MVMPSAASSCITSSTSCTISGSRALVGSSNNIKRGSMQSERAMATRCCWPPESWPGNLWACSPMPTRSNNSRASRSTWALARLRTNTGARVRLSSTLRCGNRLNCWNTIPTSRRMASMLRVSSLMLRPSIVMEPCWKSSRALKVRMKVLLPDPEGPMITTTSPRCTVRSTPRRAW